MNFILRKLVHNYLKLDEYIYYNLILYFLYVFSICILRLSNYLYKYINQTTLHQKFSANLCTYIKFIYTIPEKLYVQYSPTSKLLKLA